MEKYRNIATESSPHSGLDASIDTLSSSQMDQVLVQVRKDEVVFDDDFKFEDAKRKLRTVFCTADQSNLPRYTDPIIIEESVRLSFQKCNFKK